MSAAWSAIEAMGTGVTALIALVLLAQGQSDRRELRRREAASQASLLVATTVQARGGVLLLRNESPRSILLEHITLVRQDTWQSMLGQGREALHTVSMPTLGGFGPMPLLLHGGETREVILPGVVPLYPGLSFAIIEFRDAHGTAWKKRTDTGEFKEATPEINPFQRRVQKVVARCRFAQWLWSKLLIDPAMKAARTRQDRVPRVLTLHRALWGYWGGGEREVWTAPEASPPQWSFDELFIPPSRVPENVRDEHEQS